MRTYTIRPQRAEQLDIDFALHAEIATGHAGPVTDRAMTIQPGARVETSGPGPAKPLLHGHGFYLIAGVMTALPARFRSISPRWPPTRTGWPEGNSTPGAPASLTQ